MKSDYAISDPSEVRVSPGTLVRYLTFSESAVLEIASARGALWLGGLFVFSAALAREYDTKDLLHEPWWLAVPFLASLATSFLLYLLIAIASVLRSSESLAFWPRYREILTLYWMTAPLAWLYAIPFERFLSAASATSANLTMLGIVSLWRVALMMRVVRVLFGTGPATAFFTVMLFADSMALVALQLSPIPVINVMGGVPLSQSEQIVQSTAISVGLLGVAAWPLFFIGYLVAVLAGRRWEVPQRAAEWTKVSPSLWGIAIAAILGWALVLPFTQAEQQRRNRVEYDLTHGRIVESLEMMSSLRPDDFPPHWEPPPWLAYHNPQPPLMDVLLAMETQSVAPWVRRAFEEKFTDSMRYESYAFHWQGRDAAAKDRLLRYLEKRSLNEADARAVRLMWEAETDAAFKQRLYDLLKKAGQSPNLPEQATETAAP